MILVIGGNGYIGSRITEKFLENNIPYRVLDTKQNCLKENCFVGNVLDKESLREAVSNADTIIYLAGAHLSNYEQNYDFLIHGLSNCLELCSEYQVKRIIYASNGAVYHDEGKTKVYTEDDKLYIDEEKREYSSLICKAEHMLLDASQLERMQCVILRIGEVYGPDTYNPCLKKSVSLLGNGKTVSSKIHITDLINMLYKIVVDTSIEGIFNVCDCHPVEQLDFHEYIQKHNLEFRIKNIEYDSSIERLYWSIFGLRTRNINMSNQKICEKLKYELIYKTYKEGLNSLFIDGV